MRQRVLVLFVTSALLMFFAGFASLADEPIRVLATVDFSGAAGNIGPGYDKAMRLAIAEINAAGIEGFSGIEYRAIDCETNPSVTETKLRREILTWHPDIAGGAALETTIRTLCSAGPEFQLPMFIGGHMSMTKYIAPGEVPLTPWVSYYGYSDYFAGQFAGRFFEEMGAQRVGLIGGDYDWGYSNGIGLKAYWEQNGQPFEIAAVIYTPLDKTDYSTEVQMIKDANLDALFIPYTGAGWFSLATQLRDAGAAPEIILYGTTYSNLGGAKVTGEYGAEGIYTLCDHDPATPEWAAFVARWKAAYGEQSYPDAYANNYYQLMYWIAEVFETAGTDDPETIIQTMQEVSYQNVCISPMGPMDPYGGNTGAVGGVLRFESGSCDLDPSFGLHPVLISTYETPDLNGLEVLQIVEDMTKLEPGESYPMGG